MTGRIFSEKAAETAQSKEKDLRALCRLYYRQARAAALAAHPERVVSDAEENTAAESPFFRSRTVVLTGSAYAREFLDAFSTDNGAASRLRVAMSAQRHPCYRSKDIVPAFYLPGTPQAEREKRRTPVIGAQEAEEHVLRLLSLLFQMLYALGACPRETAVDIRLLALRVRAPAAVTGLGLCRMLIGKTQKEFARLLGIGVKSYRLREQGRRPLSEKMAADVCRLAGCRSSVLLSDEGIGWDLAEFIWKALSPDSRRRVAICTASFLWILCGTDRTAANVHAFPGNGGSAEAKQ